MKEVRIKQFLDHFFPRTINFGSALISMALTKQFNGGFTSMKAEEPLSFFDKNLLARLLFEFALYFSR